MAGLSIDDAAGLVKASDQSHEGLKQRVEGQEAEAEDAAKTPDVLETDEAPEAPPVDPLDVDGDGVMDVLEEDDE